MGLPCKFAIARRPGEKTDNAAVRETIRDEDAAGPVRQLQRAPLSRGSGRAGDVHPGLVPGRDRAPAHRHALHGLLAARPISCRKSATRCSTRSSTFCRSGPTSTGSRRRRRASIASCAGTSGAGPARRDRRGEPGARAHLGGEAPARRRRARGAPRGRGRVSRARRTRARRTGGGARMTSAAASGTATGLRRGRMHNRIHTLSGARPSRRKAVCCGARSCPCSRSPRERIACSPA